MRIPAIFPSLALGLAATLPFVAGAQADSLPGMRGMDHVGITVPDLDEASRFLERALGAVPQFDLENKDPMPSAKDEQSLGVRPGVRWKSSRLMSLGNGPTIELFEFDDAERRGPVTASDLGLQHLAIYVDDIDAVAQRIVAEGGRLLTGPGDLSGPEGGRGNKWRYTLAPWGSLIELITYPEGQNYERDQQTTRWRPRADEHR